MRALVVGLGVLGSGLVSVGCFDPATVVDGSGMDARSADPAGPPAGPLGPDALGSSPDPNGQGGIAGTSGAGGVSAAAQAGSPATPGAASGGTSGEATAPAIDGDAAGASGFGGMTGGSGAMDCAAMGDCAGSAGMPPMMQNCANGTVEAEEECDDGNTSNQDECTNGCSLAVCGDGHTQTGEGEECDDGNSNNQDACTNDCMTASCGDGHTQSGADEQCDDGNSDPGDGCTECTLPYCGDGWVDPGEECDDGNAVSGDACTGCVEPYCGDGWVDPGEECDDGSIAEPDSCVYCNFNTCGDGVPYLNITDGMNPNPREECDDGNTSNLDQCLDTCVVNTCGDGFAYGVEECDLGAANANDGVSSCTTKCREIPTDLPNTPLVLVVFEDVGGSIGAAFEDVEPGERMVAVVGLAPTLMCSNCGTPLGPDELGGSVEGYVRVGNTRWIMPFDTTGSWSVVNDAEGVLRQDYFAWNLAWEQVSPATLFQIWGGTETLSSDPGGLHGPMFPRDLSGFSDCGFTMQVQGVSETSDVYPENESRHCVVIDRGSACGDGRIAPGVESCDDGNDLGDDGCSADCLWELPAPSTEGFRHSVVGFNSTTGALQLLEAVVPSAPDCGQTTCDYPIAEAVAWEGDLVRTDVTGTARIWNDNPNDYFELYFDQGAVAYLSDDGANVWSNSAMPTASPDLDDFDLKNVVVAPGGGSVVSWHVSEVTCSGSCSCTPATCFSEPRCGMMPDGCGGWLDCGCSDGAACIDGFCAIP